MKIGIFSDAHGNKEALSAVIDDMKTRGIDRWICLGDIVGYGGNPVECLNLVSSVCQDGDVLCGNHDFGSVDPNANIDNRTNLAATRALYWTHEQIRHAGLIGYLAGHQCFKDEGDLLFVHGSPHDPMFEYIFPETILESNRMARAFARITWVAFAGHTHMPGIFSQDGTYAVTEQAFLGETVQYLMAGEKYLINVGSVGQPRDGDPRACYAIFDSAAKTVVFCRVAYDIAAAQQAIWAQGELAPRFGVRLADGQ